MKRAFTVMMVLGMSGCVMEMAGEPEGGVEEGDATHEAASEVAVKGKVEEGPVAPSAAPCGTIAPNLENRLMIDAAFPNGVNQRSGSSTGCPSMGVLQPTDDAIYFCYTVDSGTWTYLENTRTGVRGWVSDSLLRLNPDTVTRGSLVRCRF